MEYTGVCVDESVTTNREGSYRTAHIGVGTDPSPDDGMIHLESMVTLSFSDAIPTPKIEFGKQYRVTFAEIRE